MHVGDNIEDIDNTKQKTANNEVLRKRVGLDVFLLPNPMYGSWQ